MSKPVLSALAGTGCEIRSDALTRQLYATDASIYQIEPVAVAFPRTAGEAAGVMRAAADAGVPITPRGAGTGLAGGAVGEGLIIDLARHSRWISDLDLEKKTVRVGAGVVLDQLNDFLRPHGLCFGPDVATSSRATLGGMISNNSSGARAPIYGTTADHVVAVEAVLADGRVAVVGATHDAGLEAETDAVERIIAANEQAIRSRFPRVLVKRWPGYGLEPYLRARGDLSKVLAGSEGTLAAVTSAVLNVVPLPREKGLCVIFFASVAEAVRATVELLDLEPAAIEHCDRLLFDQTKGRLAFQAARDLLELDAKPCEAFLIVEFYENARARVADRLAAVVNRHLGLRTRAFTSSDEMLEVWGLRKSGLSLLTSRKGPAKPVAGIEDVAVRPERLPDYVGALRDLVEPLGLETSFYGHCASGLVHVRPMIDLHRADSIAKFRKLAEGVSTLTRQFGGSFAGEHGVGIARTEFMHDHIGPELLEAMRRIKNVFDPTGVMNPGKIFPDGRFAIDSDLRLGDGHQIPLPFKPQLKFAARDESFIANLEQCNGCGECRKDTPTMCPTYLATGEEYMSTRGRANAIRAALEGRIDPHVHPLATDALDAALGNCLSCKACKKECPSNVDMSLLKAELLYARHGERGVDLLERVVSRFDLLGRVGTAAPRLMNAALESALMRLAIEKIVGLASKRPLPAFTSERFDQWYQRRPVKHGRRGRIVLWDDCTVRYFEPQIGMAAVKVLEAAGFEIVLPQNTACCGRPAFSVGRLDVARRFGSKNVARLMKQDESLPIVFLEPSCFSMFAQDYVELDVKNAQDLAPRCILFEDFVYNLLDREPDALEFAEGESSVAIHAHCHAKALTGSAKSAALAGKIPGSRAFVMDTGCCGMAGSFGALREKYDLSVEVARPLIAQVEALAAGTMVVASGTSCRQQIAHLSKVTPVHMAEFLAQALQSDYFPANL
ncbi:MAG TPA: FAD-linked oxidase C-terminal domain-containing protein [Candidatus Bathyarchaeia archaeon]|nr:FAD-linked oxidase C-terminal domain-containing protein [Candidatus Bathyarchaeia archaeon]